MPFKPFRLVTNQEIQILLELFTQRLELFNQNYCASPLKFKIHLSQELPESKYILCTDAEDNPLILMNSSYLSIFQQHLFTTDHQDFAEVSTNVFKRLLSILTSNETIKLINHQPIESEWIYFGSPALKACLLTKETEVSLWFHPQWAKALLPRSINNPYPLTSLDKALADECLEIMVELKPQITALAKLDTLRVGQLLKTTHFTQQSLKTVQKGRPIFTNHTISLGQYNHHKSIVIARKS